MRLFLPHLWAGTGMLAALLTCGCQHNRCCCCSKCQMQAMAPMAPPLALSARTIPGAKALAQAKAPTLPPALPSAPIVHTTAKQSPADADKNQDSPPLLNDPSEEAQVQTSDRFGHDPKYRWLVGTLDYSQIQGAWLLRYVSYEDDDRYGGCVTLVGALPAASLKKGKTVRVEGSLIDPDSRQLRPAYQVEHIRPVGL